jgi:hypothetical protein
MNWHADGLESRYCADDADCNACVCFHDCSSDADCAPADTGSAPSRCVPYPTGHAHSQCFLTCDAGEPCPEHMQCVNMLEYDHFVCAWMTTGDRCQ